MNSIERKEYILKKLKENKEPQKGNVLASEIGVTRQVIVKDIAILRAEGKDIIATPEGYIMPQKSPKAFSKVIAVCHDPNKMKNELEIIIKYGGIVKDVIVEHPVYGEIKGMLMIKTLNDINNFMERYESGKAEPLSKLTGGVHLHTIEAETEGVLADILNELEEKGFFPCE